MRRLLWVLGIVAACGDNKAVPDAAPHADGALAIDAAPDAAIDAHVDAAVPPDANPLEPATLAGTGLCLDDACTQISATAHAYAPRFTLWADGATKRRWIELPAGSQIDTTDMDHWVFPVGTKIWKEFTTNDVPAVRVETRYMAKVLADDNAPGAWFFVSYAWTADQTSTTAVTQGVTDALGTAHDIPSRQQCKNCHERLRPSRVLGFGALSLDFAQPDSTLMDLDDLVAAGLLTTNPPGSAAPHFPLPGTAAETAALGYLHANCGHCHNATSDLVTNNQTPIELRLDTTHLAQVSDTRAYATTVGVSGHVVTPTGSDCPVAPCAPLTVLVTPGASAESLLYFRYNSTNPSLHMPALGAKQVDPDGRAILQTWIDGL